MVGLIPSGPTGKNRAVWYNDAMKTFFFLVIAGAVAYGIVHYVPGETKKSVLESVGLSRFFGETLPGFLRKKLSIPENPAEKRRRLAGELRTSIAETKRELDGLSQNSVGGVDVSPARAKELNAKIERAKEFLATSQAVITELEKSSSDESVFNKTAGRIIDKVLPMTAPQLSPVCTPSPR